METDTGGGSPEPPPSKNSVSPTTTVTTPLCTFSLSPLTTEKDQKEEKNENPSFSPLLPSFLSAQSTSLTHEPTKVGEIFSKATPLLNPANFFFQGPTPQKSGLDHFSETSDEKVEVPQDNSSQASPLPDHDMTGLKTPSTFKKITRSKSGWDVTTYNTDDPENFTFPSENPSLEEGNPKSEVDPSLGEGSNSDSLLFSRPRGSSPLENLQGFSNDPPSPSSRTSYSSFRGDQEGKHVGPRDRRSSLSEHSAHSEESPLQVGYVFYHERNPPHPTSVVWSEGSFFRIPVDSYGQLPKTLTPIVFRPSVSFGRPFGFKKTLTFMGTFVRVWAKGDRDFRVTPFLSGHFERNGHRKVTFVTNPSRALENSLRVTFTTSLPMTWHSPVEVNFSTLPPPSSPEPFIRTINPLPSLSPSVPQEEPLDGVLPEEFLMEVAAHSLFKVHFAVGIPENSVVPTVDFKDFSSLTQTPGTVSWKSVEQKIGQKYFTQSKNPENSLASKFVDRINAHKKNPSGAKSVLLFPGRWENFSLLDAYALGQSILNESGFSVFVCVLGHPQTTLQNAHELNPHLCGNSSYAQVEERFFFSSPVGLGDVVLGGELDFGLVSNQKPLFFLKLKKHFKPFGFREMFARVTPFHFTTYKAPTVKATGSEVSDQYLLASVVKGDKKILEALPAADIQVFPLPDPYRVCPTFQNVQLHSREFLVKKEDVLSLLSSSQERSEGKTLNPFFGKGLCSPETLIVPCDPANNLRVVKLGKTDSIKNLEHRNAPFLLLQQLSLITEIFPLSGYLFKVRLASSVSDDGFITTIRDFNRAMGDGGLFHSFYDGNVTTPFTPPPPRVSRWGSVPARGPSALVVLNPPFDLDERSVSDWASSVSLPFFQSFHWGVAPDFSSCALIEFFPDSDFTPPPVLTCASGRYKMDFFREGLPSSLRKVVSERKESFKENFKHVFTPAKPLALPKQLQDALDVVLKKGFTAVSDSKVGTGSSSHVAPLLPSSASSSSTSGVTSSSGSGLSAPLASSLLSLSSTSLSSSSSFTSGVTSSSAFGSGFSAPPVFPSVRGRGGSSSSCRGKGHKQLSPLPPSHPRGSPSQIPKFASSSAPLPSVAPTSTSLSQLSSHSSDLSALAPVFFAKSLQASPRSLLRAASPLSLSIPPPSSPSSPVLRPSSPLLSLPAPSGSLLETDLRVPVSFSNDQTFPSPASLPLPASPASPTHGEVFKAGSDPSLTLGGFFTTQGLDLEQELAEGKLASLVEKIAQPKVTSPHHQAPLHQNAILFAEVPRRTDLNFVAPSSVYRPARDPPEGLDRSTVALVPKQSVLRQSTLTSEPASPSKRLRIVSTTTPPSPSARRRPNPASARNSSAHPSRRSS